MRGGRSSGCSSAVRGAVAPAHSVERNCFSSLRRKELLQLTPGKETAPAYSGERNCSISHRGKELFRGKELLQLTPGKGTAPAHSGERNCPSLLRGKELLQLTPCKICCSGLTPTCSWTSPSSRLKTRRRQDCLLQDQVPLQT